MKAMRTQRQRRGLAKFSLPRIPDDLESASRAAAAGAGSSPNADGQDQQAQQAAAPQDPGLDGGGTAPAAVEGGGEASEVRPDGASGGGAVDPGEPARLPDTAPPDIMIRPDGLVTENPHTVESAPPALPPMDPLGLNAEIGSPEPAAAATREQPQQPQSGMGIGGMMLTSPILGEETAMEEEEERGTARQVDGPAELGEETGSYPPREEIPESEFVDSVLSGSPSTTSDAGGDGAGGRTGCPGSIGRWHPSPSFDSCTNSASYPQQWDDSPALAGELMHDTVDLCCGATFGGPGEECVVHNVCETVDLTYDEGFGPDPAPGRGGAEGPAGAEATERGPGPGEAPVVMHTPAVVKEATSAPLKIDAEADRSAPAARPAIQPGGGPEGSSEGAALAREDPVGMDAEPPLHEARIGPGPDGTPVEMDAEPSIREAPIGFDPYGTPVQEEARAATREDEESDAADPTVEEEAAEAESEIAEALAGGGVGEVEAEQLEMELQRAVEDNNIDELEDVEEELELIEEEEEAALEGLDDGFDGAEDEVYPAYEDVSVTEEGEDGYVPPDGAGDGSHQETTRDEVRGDVRTGFPEDPDDGTPGGRDRPPAPSPPSGLDGVDGLRDAPYEGDGFTSQPPFQLLRPKGSPGGGGSSPFPTAAAGGLAALALLALYVRRRRRSPPRRTLEYSALGTGDWDGTFSDDISFGRRYSDDDDDDGCGSLGSYGSDEERGNGTVLEMGGMHETDANGGLCLREVNG